MRETQALLKEAINSLEKQFTLIEDKEALAR